MFSPAVLPPPPAHDLTALQQTHVLGDFQHRFQQPRFPQFQNQPLLFSQQTEFGSFPNQRQPSQHVAPPPQQQAPPAIFQQPNQFRQPSTVPKQNFNQFEQQRDPNFVEPAFQDQSFRQQNFRQPSNSQVFSNPPAQTESFRPNSNSQVFSNPPAQTENFRQPSNSQAFPNPPPQTENFRQPSNNQVFSNPPAQNENFRQPSNGQVFSNPPAQTDNFRPNSNSQVFPNPPAQTDNFRPNSNSQVFPNPPAQTENFRQPSNSQAFPNPPQQNQGFRNNQQQSFQDQPQFFEEPRKNQFNENRGNFFPEQRNPSFRSQENNQRFPQADANFPQQQQQPEREFQARPAFQQPIPNYQTFGQSKPEDIPVSFNPNRKPAFLPTQLPKTSEEDVIPKRPLLPLIPTDFSEPTTEASSQTKGFFLQKSQEQDYEKNFEYQPNAISPAPPRVQAKPKPEVKEITINLATTPATEKSGRIEKTQEELINEQIQKLLQGHNLELAGNGAKPELPVPELPAHLKDKYQIKLVNSEVLSKLKTPKKKEKKPEPTAALPPLPDLPDHIKKQYDIKLVQKDELFKQFKIGTGGKIVTNADLVSPLPGKPNTGNESTVFLANGQQLEIVHLPKNEEKTTSKPPKELFEELRAGGEIPAGANYELIKHNANGEIEKVNDLTSAKKVTFVLLEEQPDGTVKVQGVKGNSNGEKTDKDSVESLIKKINDGSLKLPPSQSSSQQSIITNEIPRIHGKTYVTATPRLEYSTTEPATTYRSYLNDDIYSTLSVSDVPETTFAPTEFATTIRPKSKSRPHFLPTPGYNFESTTRRHKSSKRPSRRKPTSSTTSTTTAQYEYDDEDYNQRSSNYNGEGPLPQDVVGQESNLHPSPSLTKILQNYGLYEMAKFLDQSGLDTILNETGPYTVFIPTDAAFANLQEQLGGTDKAEDKFRENPRLLSGLLLHHVVPGSFKVSDLQDEMTGVSLAGTQLRVNTYNSEKKDSVVTINGAVVSPDKRDIPVPQGLAHAVDRVLFPLPVGDLVQTLKGDRERRFGKFVKSIEASGLIDMLTGSKTYTVFAPTDKAFAALSDEELDKLLARREAARTIVLRHVMPGTLYSAGMHFFQIKESMERGQKITIQKELGKVKANSAQVVTANIPSTNGVIHVLDTLL